MNDPLARFTESEIEMLECIAQHSLLSGTHFELFKGLENEGICSVDSWGRYSINDEPVRTAIRRRLDAQRSQSGFGATE